MIKVNFYHSSSGDITGFKISGHAFHGRKGSDIVCAAVSSAAYMTANTVTDVIGVNADISLDESDDSFMELKIPEKDIGRVQDILLGFELHIKGLSGQYPKNVKIR